MEKEKPDLTGKIMIKYVGKDNPLAPPKVVYIKRWSNEMDWWITPEINGNPFNVSSEKHLIPFDYNTYVKLKLEWDIENLKRNLNERKKKLKEWENKL